jgi:probable HAF family extracellular repeat protein
LLSDFLRPPKRLIDRSQEQLSTQEATVKSRTLTWITAMVFLAVLALPVQLAAQHTRYKLIDIGTLGGPVSYESVNGEGNQILNNSGVISSGADTSIPDLNAPDACINLSCFLAHAFRWNNGVLTDLGALAGNNSYAGAINARGWSTGQSQNGVIDPVTGLPETRAVLWKENEIIDLGTLGGNESLGIYVNDGGQVIGMATINTDPDPFSFLGAPTHTFIWKDGEKVDLGTLGGPDAFAAAGCVNQRQGLVVGGSFTSSISDPIAGVPPQDPFLWENGTMLDLGTLGGTFGSAQCANNRGQVIGVSSLAENPFACLTPGEPGCHPFLWEQGVLTDLGTLGGDNGTPIWINNAGDVVGEAALPGNETSHAFLWRKGEMTDLGTLDGSSHATAINSRGQIVGYFRLTDRTDPPFRHPFIWEKGGPMLDLNTLIPANSGLELVAADNINERGEIVGVGVPARCFVDFCGHLFLLIPCAASDTQGCEDNGEGTNAAVQSNPASAINSSTTSPQRRPTPKGRMAAWRAQMAHRYHIPGLGGPKD